ncbi:hypothetical protein IKB17_02020 [bacterium]|nr:hypothetical protein [bacterium]
MDKYKKYSGVLIFAFAIGVLFYFVWNLLSSNISTYSNSISKLNKAERTLEELKQKELTIQNKLKRLQEANVSVQKKIFSPSESDLGNDSLFFTLYTDIIEMLKMNSVKIKSIDYVYNPANDKFVTDGGDGFFVCDLNMKLISNFADLGKLIQNIYQYPYYIKINGLQVVPYKKDRKILLTNLSIRLYTHSEPKE